MATTTISGSESAAVATARALSPSSRSSSNDGFMKSLSALRELLSFNSEVDNDEFPSSWSRRSPTPPRPHRPPQPEPDRTLDSKDLYWLRQRLDAATKELEQEKSARRQVQESHAQLMEQNEALTKRMESLAGIQSLKEDLDMACARWKDERDKAQRDQHKLKLAVEQIAKERSQALQNVDTCQTKILSLQKQVRELQTQRDSQRESWEAERSTLQESINTLQETISSFESAHDTLQNRTDELTLINEDLRTELEAMQREYDEMEAFNAECDESKRQCQAEVERMREEVSHAQSQSVGWKRTLDQTDRLLQDNNREIVELQQKLEEERSAHERTKQQLQLISSASESKRRHEYSQLEQKVLDLTEQLKDRVHKKLDDQKQQSELVTLLNARERQLLAKDNEIQQLKQKQEALSKLDTSNRARLEALRKSVANFKSQPDTQHLHDELIQTKAYLQSSQAEIQQAVAKLSTVVSPRETISGSRSLNDLIAQLVADKEHTKPPMARTPSPARQKSPRKLAQLAHEAAKSLGKKARSVRAS